MDPAEKYLEILRRLTTDEPINFSAEAFTRGEPAEEPVTARNQAEYLEYIEDSWYYAGLPARSGAQYIREPRGARRHQAAPYTLDHLRLPMEREDQCEN